MLYFSLAHHHTHGGAACTQASEPPRRFRFFRREQKQSNGALVNGDYTMKDLSSTEAHVTGSTTRWGIMVFLGILDFMNVVRCRRVIITFIRRFIVYECMQMYTTNRQLLVKTMVSPNLCDECFHFLPTKASDLLQIFIFNFKIHIFFVLILLLWTFFLTHMYGGILLYFI